MDKVGAGFDGTRSYHSTNDSVLSPVKISPADEPALVNISYSQPERQNFPKHCSGYFQAAIMSTPPHSQRTTLASCFDKIECKIKAASCKIALTVSLFVSLWVASLCKTTSICSLGIIAGTGKIFTFLFGAVLYLSYKWSQYLTHGVFEHCKHEILMLRSGDKLAADAVLDEALEEFLTQDENRDMELAMAYEVIRNSIDGATHLQETMQRAQRHDKARQRRP